MGVILQDFCGGHCQNRLRQDYNHIKDNIKLYNIPWKFGVHWPVVAYGEGLEKYYDFNLLNMLIKYCGENTGKSCKWYMALWERKTHQVEEKCMELVSPFKSKGNWNDVNCQSHRYPTCHIPPIQEPPGNF